MFSASTISKFSSALSKLSEEGRRQLAEAIRSNLTTVEPYRKLFTYYPDHGPLRREMRLMTRRGHALLTFTPLEGMSEVMQAFLPGGRLPGEAEF